MYIAYCNSSIPIRFRKKGWEPYYSNFESTAEFTTCDISEQQVDSVRYKRINNHQDEQGGWYIQ